MSFKVAGVKLLPDDLVYILVCNGAMNSASRPKQSTIKKSNSYTENEFDRRGVSWADHVLDEQSVTRLSEVSIPAALTSSEHHIKAKTEALLTNQKPVTDPISHQQADFLQGQGTRISEDVAHQRMVASLFAIFLGSLGIHKFYLGLNQAGIMLLAIHMGVWFLAMVIGVLTLGLGILITIPFAMMISILISLGTFAEGLIYLTKSDQDFKQRYLIEKRAWF